jgi:RNA polymerase sigma factor (sigma-70 family)
LKGTENPSPAIERLACGGLSGRREEFWAHFNLAWPILERFAKFRVSRRGLEENLVRDCVQNAFERVCRYRAGYRGTTEGEFWAWFGKVCDNSLRTALRKERRHPRNFSDLNQFEEVAFVTPSMKMNPGVTVENRDAFQALELCLQEIDELGRTVICLRYWPPQLSQRAAAELLGCSPAQVFKLEHRSLKLLLSCLTAKGVEYVGNMSM